MEYVTHRVGTSAKFVPRAPHSQALSLAKKTGFGAVQAIVWLAAANMVSRSFTEIIDVIQFGPAWERILYHLLITLFLVGLAAWMAMYAVKHHLDDKAEDKAAADAEAKIVIAKPIHDDNLNNGVMGDLELGGGYTDASLSKTRSRTSAASQQFSY
jgi:hypothetical protein